MTESFVRRKASRIAVAAITVLSSASLLAESAQAAPSPVGTATAAAASNTATVSRPAGLVAGDVLVASVTARASAATPVTAPVGWTPVRRDACAGSGGVELTQALFVRVASPSEPPTSAWKLGAASGVAVGVAAYRGVDGASPVASSGGVFSRNSRGIQTTSLATVANGLVTAVYGRSSDGAITLPAGTAQRYAASTATASVVAADTAGLSGTTGSLVARPAATAACNIGQLVVLRPGAGGSGTPPPPPPPPPPSGDGTAPSVPGSVRTTGATQTSVLIAWNGSTDNVRVTGYGLYRDGAATGSATGTNATFTGLQCGKSYTFAVDAYDAAGNHSARGTVTASTSACPATPPPPPPPTGTKTVVQVDRNWTCSGRVDLDLVKVTMRNADADAITLAAGCTGRIGRVEVETWKQDGIKVQNQPNPAHDLVIEGGYVKGWDLSPGAHQDGIQAMGGARITFRDLRVDVVGAQNLFINRAGSGATTPTDIVCDGCVLGPNVATPLLVNVAVTSGARNTLVCTSPRYGRSTSLTGGSVNVANSIAPVGDSRCANVTGR
jgi:Fibronectin type III domain